MSFKREGDDAALLRNLKMRRVGELLGELIPDDEATLLSNGRLCCIICSHRPIFDTLTMLSLHRKGKKHIDELSKFLLHKSELDLRQLKTVQRDYLRSGQGTLQPPAGRGKQKSSSGLHRRKPVLEVPTCSIKPQELSPSAQSQVRHYLKGLWRKRALEKTVEKCRENYGEISSRQVTAAESPDQQVPDSCAPAQQAPENPVPTRQESLVDRAAPAVRHEVDEAKRKQAEYYLQLKMSGWIKDADGKWSKDPNAEFDSDEDEPVEQPS